MCRFSVVVFRSTFLDLLTLVCLCKRMCACFFFFIPNAFLTVNSKLLQHRQLWNVDKKKQQKLKIKRVEKEEQSDLIGWPVSIQLIFSPEP